MEKVVIYGAGALAIQIVAYNRRYKMFDIVGLVDDNAKAFDYAPEIPLYSFEDFMRTYPAGNQCVVGGG